MSYEYARIPFKKGVNVVLGISVALGQSSTERSKRLSDLIRFGKDEARVTLVLDNSPRNGRRPVSRIKKDQIFLTRNLRRDGKYWFELENTAANKIEVNRLLSKFEIDPENMLIIMHQNMVNQFSVLSSQEKLRMVEAAVGFESYRENILKALKKLSRTLSQGDSVGKLLESAQQTLAYWRGQYDRYQQKKQLILKRRFLERELAWAEVQKRENIVAKLKEQKQESQYRITKIESKAIALNEQLDESQIRLKQNRDSWRSIFENRLLLERELAKLELTNSTSNHALKETASWIDDHRNDMEKVLGNIESIEVVLREKTNPLNLRTQLEEIRVSYDALEDSWVKRFSLRNASLKKSVEGSIERLTNVGLQISDLKRKTDSISLDIENTINDLVDRKISLALLEYQKKQHSKALKRLDKELRQALVSQDIESMYESYSRLYLELKEKARLVAENREKALEEVNARSEAWRNVIHNLLDQVNVKYKKILSEAYAVGVVKLVNEEDIEDAGLEILVGFKGVTPVPLNAYTQSGGERSTATITFLLALQQHVHSPFRAVDEYDVHMDPKNKEIIANLLVSSVTGLDSQYLAITPSQITFTGKDVHLITVQNVEGASLIKEVA